jgi:hypothetical protein
VEKILEVWDQCSIVKTFFVTAGGTKHWHCYCHSCFFFSILKFSQNENHNGEPKELHFSLMYKKNSQKKTKISKRYAKMIQF